MEFGTTASPSPSSGRTALLRRHAASPARFPRRSHRRGQTRLESAVALGVLLLAGIGAWMLYKDAIVETTRAMISFFTSEDAS